MKMPPIIQTGELKISDLPPINASWQQIASFALTFDPKEIGYYGEDAAQLSNAKSTSGLAELRAHLYVEQRRWNHFGKEPDSGTLEQLRNVLEWLRARLIL